MYSVMKFNFYENVFLLVLRKKLSPLVHYAVPEAIFLMFLSLSRHTDKLVGVYQNPSIVILILVHISVTT